MFSKFPKGAMISDYCNSKSYSWNTGVSEIKPICRHSSLCFMGLPPFILFILFQLVFFLPRSSADEQALRFHSLSIEKGLSQCSVFAIFQDRAGFMWFGTQDGLNMFDGYKFTIFRHNPEDAKTLSAGHITALLEDKNGSLWIGTNGGGLNTFNRAGGTFSSLRHDSTNPHSLSHDTITTLFNDSSGNLWVGTEWGLNVLDRQTGSFRRFIHDERNPNSLGDNSITSIH